MVGGPLHLVGTFLRQPLLILVGPVLRQIGGLLRELGPLLGLRRGLLGLLSPFPCPLGGLSQLAGPPTRLEGDPQHLQIRRGDARLLRLAEVLLLRGLAGVLGRGLAEEPLRRGFARAWALARAWVLGPGPGCPPGHAVGLAGLGHALTGGGLLRLVSGHDHLLPATLPASARLGT